MIFRPGLLLAVWVLCLVPVPLGATQVEVVVELEEGMAPSAMQSKTVAEGFTQAVMLEAEKLLPASLPTERTILLREFMSDRTDRYVLSYSRLEYEADGNAVRAVFDVRVNPDLLRQDLKRLGLFQTAGDPMPYWLSVQGQAMESWNEISRLQELSGLYVERNAETELNVESLGEDSWSASLQYDNATIQATGSPLASVWLNVWGRYFEYLSKRDGVGATVLQMAGWYAPDGVQAFNDVLGEWRGAIEESVLTGVRLDEEFVSASWELKIIDLDQLRDLLARYVSGRGLSFELSSAMQQAQTQDTE